ncbi:pyridoxal phosphate phosphatase [Gammaproteobacteria bacterium]|nr:pyridoxal phosphate phosphatase [Gammaproteobacteria bacterium]
MQIQLVVTDLDGTLLNDHEEVSQKNIQAFKQLKDRGIHFAVATGRAQVEARYAYEAIDATDYFIGMNGAQIINLKTGAIIDDACISAGTALHIFNILKTEDVFFQIYSKNKVMCTPKAFEKRFGKNIKQEYLERFAKTIIVSDDIHPALNFSNKFFVVLDDHACELRIREQLTECQDISIVSSSGHYLEIIPHTVHKGIALTSLCQHLNIPLSSVMAIGDSYNDLEMLEAAGLGIAMGNACSALKDIADHSVANNNDSGVAEAIDRFIFDLD